MMKLKIAAAVFMAATLTSAAQAQSIIAAWDFFGESLQATSSADFFSADLDVISPLSRGAGASASSGNNSFRTTGFQNNGIALTNTDYFEFSLSASAGHTMSLSSIDIKVNGTQTFVGAGGVMHQWAYSFDGVNFTLIGSPTTTTGTLPLTVSFDLSGTAALQNIDPSTTVTFRYYATGQTSTGGWGFFSASAGDIGLSISGSGVAPAVIPEPATYMLFGIGLLVCVQQFRRRRAAAATK